MSNALAHAAMLCEHKHAHGHRLFKASKCRETDLRRERGANDVALKCRPYDHAEEEERFTDKEKRPLLVARMMTRAAHRAA